MPSARGPFGFLPSHDLISFQVSLQMEGKDFFLISCPDMKKKKKGGKKKQSKQLWIMGAVKEKYRPGRWKGNSGDARVKDRLPASRNNVFSSWKNSLTEGRLLFPLERAH